MQSSLCEDTNSETLQCLSCVVSNGLETIRDTKSRTSEKEISREEGSKYEMSELRKFHLKLLISKNKRKN